LKNAKRVALLYRALRDLELLRRRYSEVEAVHKPITEAQGRVKDLLRALLDDNPADPTTNEDAS
jgi:hypothetical protein